MWRCHRLRASLVALVAVPTYLSSPAERMAPRCSGVTSDAAGEVPIADCAGLGALPAPIVEDLSLSFDGIEAIVCEEVRPGCACPLSALSELSFLLCMMRGKLSRIATLTSCASAAPRPD